MLSGRASEPSAPTLLRPRIGQHIGISYIYHPWADSGRLFEDIWVGFHIGILRLKNTLSEVGTVNHGTGSPAFSLLEDKRGANSLFT